MTRSKRKIIILDTTLREGDQSPGMAFSYEDKIKIALLLEKLGADVIEAGFPACSGGELEVIKDIAAMVRKSAISVMARALPDDIETAGKALEQAAKKYLHITLATSPIHREYKLKKTKDEIIKIAVESVALAGSLSDVVEMGAEDAVRTEYEFLAEFCTAVTEAGAGVVNISDTVGFSQPDEFGKLIKALKKDVAAFADGSSVISVHCHNDLGLSLANTLAGIAAGAGQAECTLLGIGERAGNAALEELVTTIKTREDYYRSIYTDVRPEFIDEAVRAVSRAISIGPHPCKPVVGSNAARHASGIHQHAVALNPEAYSIIENKKESFSIELSRHSGRTGLREKIKEIAALDLPDEKMEDVYVQFKKTAENRKTVSLTELLLLLHEYGHIKTSVWTVKKIYYFDVQSAEAHEFSAFVELVNQNGTEKWINKSGVTKWEAIISAMKSAFHFDIKIIDFSTSLFGDEEAWSERFRLEAEFEGNVYSDESHGKDSLILFVESYLNIVNRIIARYQFSDGD